MKNVFSKKLFLLFSFLILDGYVYTANQTPAKNPPPGNASSTGITPSLGDLSILASPQQTSTTSTPNSGEKRKGNTIATKDPATGSAEKKQKKASPPTTGESPVGRFCIPKQSTSPEEIPKKPVDGNKKATNRSYDVLKSPNNSGRGNGEFRSSYSYTEPNNPYAEKKFSLSPANDWFTIQASPQKSSSQRSTFTSELDDLHETADQTKVLGVLSECIFNEQDAYISLLGYMKKDGDFVNSILQLEHIGDSFWNKIPRKIRKKHTSKTILFKDDLLQKLVNISLHPHTFPTSATVMQLDSKQQAGLSILLKKIPAGCSATNVETLPPATCQKMRRGRYPTTEDLIMEWKTELDQQALIAPEKPIHNYSFSMRALNVSQAIEFALQFLTPAQCQAIYYVKRKRDMEICLNLKECYKDDQNINKVRTVRTVRFSIKPKSTGAEGSFATHPQVGLWVVNFEFTNAEGIANNGHLVVQDIADFSDTTKTLEGQINALNQIVASSFIHADHTDKIAAQQQKYIDKTERHLTKTGNFLRKIKESLDTITGHSPLHPDLSHCIIALREVLLKNALQYDNLQAEYAISKTTTEDHDLSEEENLLEEVDELYANCCNDENEELFQALQFHLKQSHEQQDTAVKEQKTKILNFIASIEKSISKIKTNEGDASDLEERLEEITTSFSPEKDTKTLKALYSQAKKLNSDALKRQPSAKKHPKKGDYSLADTGYDKTMTTVNSESYAMSNI